MYRIRKYGKFVRTCRIYYIVEVAQDDVFRSFGCNNNCYNIFGKRCDIAKSCRMSMGQFGA